MAPFRLLLSVNALILANLLPLVGVLAGEWNMFSVLLIYWGESAIIGLFTVLKMLKAEGEPGATADSTPASLAALKLFFLPFFGIHFGLFMVVHLVFICVLFFSTTVQWQGIAMSVLALFLSHATSYYFNFWQGREYQRIRPDQLFLAPYPRIIIMHLTILLGGVLVLSTGKAVWALGLMVVLKTLVDLIQHVTKHLAITKKALSQKKPAADAVGSHRH